MDRNDSEQGGAEQELNCFLTIFSPQCPINSFSLRLLFFLFILSLFEVLGKKIPVIFMLSYVLTVDTEHVSFDIYFDKYLESLICERQCVAYSAAKR